MGPLQANCHFLYDAATGKGLIVDPGGDPDEIIKAIDTARVSLKAILLTHGHDDHMGGTAELKEATKAAVYGSSEVKEVLASPGEYQLFPGLPAIKPAKLDHELSKDQTLDINGFEVIVLTTPGHTPGSLTFYADKCLFCGDLLFHGSVGRTDFPGGSFEDLSVSVRKLFKLFPGDTAVYPGHGSSTTLNQERSHNPFLAEMGL